MLFLICLCLTQVNENELYYDQSMQISPIETYFGTDMEKIEKCIFIEHEFIQAKTPFELIFTNSNEDLRIIFTDRSATMKLSNFILSMFKHPLYIIYNLIFSTDSNIDVNNYLLRINWFYLGKGLSQSKYSSTLNVSSSKNPKSALLIIILLFMCGDTGASINPGPVGINDAIDPDLNHFTNDFEFQSHSVETFAEHSYHVRDSFNIIHNNARSLMADGRLDEYLMLLKNVKATFDILVFTESWLTPDDIDQCKIAGYQAIHLVRPSDDPNF